MIGLEKKHQGKTQASQLCWYSRTKHPTLDNQKLENLIKMNKKKKKGSKGLIQS